MDTVTVLTSPDGRRWGYLQPCYTGTDADEAQAICQQVQDAGCPYARLYLDPATGVYYVDAYDEPLDQAGPSGLRSRGSAPSASM